MKQSTLGRRLVLVVFLAALPGLAAAAGPAFGGGGPVAPPRVEATLEGAARAEPGASVAAVLKVEVKNASTLDLQDVVVAVVMSRERQALTTSVAGGELFRRPGYTYEERESPDSKAHRSQKLSVPVPLALDGETTVVVSRETILSDPEWSVARVRNEDVVEFSRPIFPRDAAPATVVTLARARVRLAPGERRAVPLPRRARFPGRLEGGLYTVGVVVTVPDSLGPGRVVAARATRQVLLMPRSK